MLQKSMLLIVWFISLSLSGCIGAPPTPESLSEGTTTAIAVQIFATQTAEAPPATATPTPTLTLTPTQSPSPTSTSTWTPTPPPTSTPSPTLTPTPQPTATSTNTPTPAATSTPTLPPPPTATPTPDQQWVLVADSATDYPGPIQDRKWWYLWSDGRNNFIWQDMVETPDCYKSPNEYTLAICPDRMTVDTCDPGEHPGRRGQCSRGDAALLWKAREGGTYRFEWNSSAVEGETTLWFYKHLDFHGVDGPGSEFSYSAVVENVIQWELFFWLPQYDTPYRVKVYKLQK